jgi:hypothetical protein
MNRAWKFMISSAIVTLGCDRSSTTGVEGTYPLILTYNEDTCADDENTSESFQLRIERDGDAVTFTLANAGTLTGTFDNETRIMTVQGPIVAQNPGGGTFPGQMFMVARVTEGEVNADGRIDFEGTFPGIPGTCSRHFLATGERANRSVFPLTGS